MLVKLRVSETSFNDIMQRVIDAGQLDRIGMIDGAQDGLGIDLRDVVLVVDPNAMIGGTRRG